MKYGLPKLEYEKGNRKGVSYGEWKDQGKSSWKNLIRADIDYAISLSESYEEFLEQMRSMHYQIREGTSREEGVILSLKLPGQGRACRTKKKTLGEAYTVAAIRERIGKEWRSYPVPKPPRLQRCRCISDGKTSGGSPDIKPVMSETFTRSRTAMPVEMFMRSIGPYAETFNRD